MAYHQRMLDENSGRRIAVISDHVCLLDDGTVCEFRGVAHLPSPVSCVIGFAHARPHHRHSRPARRRGVAGVAAWGGVAVTAPVIVVIASVAASLVGYVMGRIRGHAVGYQRGRREVLESMAWNTAPDTLDERLRAFDDAMEKQ